jgi:hypothetical protein
MPFYSFEAKGQGSVLLQGGIQCGLGRFENEPSIAQNKEKILWKHSHLCMQNSLFSNLNDHFTEKV